MITRPHGLALSFHRNVWNIIYYLDGRRKIKSTGLNDFEEAELARNKFFEGSEMHIRKEHDKDTLYVYTQKPYYVKVQKKVVGRYYTMEEAKKGRDEYLKLNKQ